MRFAGCAGDGLREAFSFAGVIDIKSVSEITGERMNETLPLGAIRTVSTRMPHACRRHLIVNPVRLCLRLKRQSQCDNIRFK